MLFSMIYCVSIAQWTEIDTGIDDKLNDATIIGNFGVVVGENGIYYSTSGISATSVWSRFNIQANFLDSVVYNNTSFTSVSNFVGWGNFEEIIAAGEDTVNNRAVIFLINLNTLNHQLLFYSTFVSKVNDLQYSSIYQRVFCVGDSGLMLRYHLIDGLDTISDQYLNYNFNSVAISQFSGEVAVAGDGIVVRVGAPTNSVFYPSETISSISYNLSDQLFGVDSSFYQISNTSVTSYDFFDRPELKGTSITNANNNLFLIGTEDGIYRQYINTNVLELQPSSDNFFIKNLYSHYSDGHIYAVCKDGKILFTSNFGGESFPFVKVVNSSGCLESTTTFNVITGSANTFNWSQDGQFLGGGSSLSHEFSQAGFQSVVLIYGNSLYTDTLVHNFQIFDQILTDQISSFSVSDTILCNLESLEIKVFNPDTNAVYQLWRYDNSFMYGGSGSNISTFDTLSFFSDYINQSGNYYLRAKHIQANCYTNFEDTIRIIVEKTNADFRSSLINANIGESVNFYNKSAESNFFNWKFQTHQNTFYSSEANPSLYFSDTGIVNIQLISTSINGCVDTNSRDDLAIVNVDSAFFSQPWINQFKTNSSMYPFYRIHEISDGFFLTGYFNEYPVLFSTHGKKWTITEDYDGFYCAKYDFNGVLKYVFNSSTANAYSNNIWTYGDIDIDEDSDKNIYLITRFINDFIDNRGDTISYLDISNTSVTKLIKLDSLGRVVWFKEIFNFSHVDYLDLIVNSDNDIFISGTSPYQGIITIVDLFSNDTIFIGDDSNLYSSLVINLDQDGNLVSWFGSHSMSSVTALVDRSELFIDSENNKYFTGTFRQELKIYSADGSVDYILPDDSEYLNYSYILKFDSSNQLVWKSYFTNPEFYAQVMTFTKLDFDEDNNLYFSGKGNHYFTNSSIYYINPSLDSTEIESFDYFVCKIDSLGNLIWFNFTNDNFLGTAFDLRIHNDKVYVLGHIRQSGSSNFEANFNSVDGNVILVNLNQSNSFFAIYSTSGNLEKLYKNNEFDFSFIYDRGLSFFIDSSGSIYYSGYPDEYYYNENDTDIVPNFGVEMDSLFFYDGQVSKLILDDLDFYTPIVLIDSVMQICSGDQIYLQNNFVVANLNNDTTISFVYPSYLGIDSVIRFHIFVHNQQIDTIVLHQCVNSSITFQDGYEVTSIQNDFTHQIHYFSSFGCDSSIYYQIIVKNTDTSHFEINLCKGESLYFSNGDFFPEVNESFQHYENLITYFSCDSVKKTNVNVIYHDPTTLQFSVCKGDTLDVPGFGLFENIPESFIMTLHFNSVYNCDSTRILIVDVSENQVIIETDSEMLFTNNEYDDYFWIDCQTHDTLSSNSTFYPSFSGDFKLVASLDNCLFVSECFNFSPLGLLDLDVLNSKYVFYPSPTNQFVHLKGIINSDFYILVKDVNGRIISKFDFSQNDTTIVNLPFSEGIYYLELFDSNDVKLHFQKVVKY